MLRQFMEQASLQEKLSAFDRAAALKRSERRVMADIIRPREELTTATVLRPIVNPEQQAPMTHQAVDRQSFANDIKSNLGFLDHG